MYTRFLPSHWLATIPVAGYHYPAFFLLAERVGTDLTAQAMPSSSSQPSLRVACRSVEANRQGFMSLTLPSPKVSRRRKRAQPKPPAEPTPTVPCGVCNENCEGDNVIGCEGECYKWYHIACVGISYAQFLSTYAGKEEVKWLCQNCTKIPANIPTPRIPPNVRSANLSWGESSLSEFEENIKSCYKEIVKWRKNLFLLPSGRAGKDFILEMKRLIDLFVNKTPYAHFALNALMVIIPLLLQKPSKSSKSSDHSKYLSKRLAWWKEGKVLDILRECKVIQERMSKSKHKRDPDHARRVFVKLMLQGKVSSALRWLDPQCNNSSLIVDEGIVDKLKQKHPPAQPCSNGDLLRGPLNKIEPVLFDMIDGHKISKAALHTKGSGGPTQVDSDAWKRFLCSKSFGNASKELCDSIASLARVISTEQIPSAMLQFYTAGRLVALDKCPGQSPVQIRPIGIGEVLRRIIGKAVMTLLKSDITQAAGPLQACAGHKGGVEAAVHAMKKVFDKPNVEAVLLVDATNAFNNMNRQTALHNIQVICPEMSTYLINTYREPPSLYVANSKGAMILSEEGCTQGDNAGMSFYACNTLPLITLLNLSSPCEQAWFADDSAAAGEVEKVKGWWDILNKNGPTMGYLPNPSKTWLILKNSKTIEKAQGAFKGTGVNITSYGKKHLGACLGSVASKHDFVSEKVEGWVSHLQKLSEFAESDPHAAYAAFTYGFIQKWKYVQRTMSGIDELFQPIEDCIRNKFIPAIVGRAVSDTERLIFSLPTKLGGLNIPNPVSFASKEYEWSRRLTETLTNRMVRQVMFEEEAPEETAERHRSIIKEIKEEKASIYKILHQSIYEDLNIELRKSLTNASQKGASIWLNTLPIKDLCFYLNKQEFRDAVALRYNFKIDGIASNCACGSENSIDHALVCRLGGYTIMRHNEVRDVEASLLREVCRDVQVEPALIPLSGQQFPASTNTSENARLDVSARGLWSPMEKAFLDVRIFHPNANSNRNKSLPQLYNSHESEKKRTYNQRIIEVEHATFTPLVFSTSGGESPECHRFHKRLATLLSDRRKESYSETITYIRRRIRFCILRTTLIALRGYRMPKQSGQAADEVRPLHEVDIAVSEAAHSRR